MLIWSTWYFLSLIPDIDAIIKLPKCYPYLWVERRFTIHVVTYDLAMTTNKETRLKLIKLAHTLIWLFYNVVIFYFLYAVIINKIDKWVWICLGLVALEGIILLIFKWVCPLTLVARRYSDSQRDNFDIYLPNLLAKYNKIIYSAIVILGIIILCYQLFA